MQYGDDWSFTLEIGCAVWRYLLLSPGVFAVVSPMNLTRPVVCLSLLETQVCRCSLAASVGLGPAAAAAAAGVHLNVNRRCALSPARMMRSNLG